ncbi:hypothetical protein C8Q75DRAFT_65583 [Abortiporus biennis]|nr:hypothetical protein C8Q75DRAFT_65583 [Abortiporus biennis]
MQTDDLPWPELGNVSRGATRGNQGQKGVLSAPDNEGRGILQLRVQPGVLAVRLNRQSTDWYRTLDNEVNAALKLTKTYWRKARRRQDYDARADQDHMELHEWLQQLKDKVMTHLELLMQKGEIQGPPYTMPDHLELTFLKKFIERQAVGIPHNPRLRQAYMEGHSPKTLPSIRSDGSSSPSSSWDALDQDDFSDDDASVTAVSSSNDIQTLLSEVKFTQRTLKGARATLARARKETHDTFIRYKACVDAEDKAVQQVTIAEERRDVLLTSLAEAYRTMGLPSSGMNGIASPNQIMDPSGGSPSSSNRPMSSRSDMTVDSFQERSTMMSAATWEGTTRMSRPSSLSLDSRSDIMCSRKRSWDIHTGCDLR